MIRQANIQDLNSIMKVIQEAQHRMKQSGMTQWQNNYPNSTIIDKDIQEHAVYVYEIDQEIVGTMSVFSFDPVYETIEGTWLNNNTYKVIHRIAISDAYKNQKLAETMIQFVFDHFKIRDIRIDTHPKNSPMISSLIRQGFKMCGIIHVTTDTDSKRYAYHKHI